MDQFFKVRLSLISFIFIPIVFFWHPNWMGLFGIQPYWPLFWLLPWSMIHGSSSGLILGLFLGLTLDAISLGNSFTQIPGLILCGFWFGGFKVFKNVWVGYFRYGLLCVMGCFFCDCLNFLQILITHFPGNNVVLFLPSFKNVLVQIFLTGLFAPLFCSQLFRLFKTSK